ncbi:hypothetical protein [Hansschlegelia plantiphila]|uniref:Uncharacterized protein n=1 Tax=Hansschlegelia plantiphila TaxID=374655 RepID=A0A9W6MVN1_9HYPH|nr:hypothetical protein [Hansschlegelia plantiphila]GLK68112.1 hypothetical protein GCM10008179_17500 [Hansschlegelia plantiphila]
MPKHSVPAPAAGGAMPAAAQTEYRALTIYSAPPTGCIVFPVTRNGFEPHLRLGEIAIVDSGDRELQNGELYVIRWNHPLEPDGIKALVQIWPRTHRGTDGNSFAAWWVGSLNRPREAGEVEQWLKERRPLSCSERPFRADHLREKLVGRVIGIYQATDPAIAALNGRAQS